MKKIGIAGVLLAIIAAIYYFTIGSAELESQMKAAVKQEVVLLETKGFSIDKKELSKNKEHYIVTIGDPEKIVSFFNEQGSKIPLEEVKELKGAKLGVDVSYLRDSYSAISFDMYPLALPSKLNSTALDTDDKKAMKKLNELIEKKAFLVHVDFNKFVTGFKGYMKDIDESLDDKKEAYLIMKGLKFSGDLDEEKISSFTQALKTLQITDKTENFSMQLDDLSTDYAKNGSHQYDYTMGHKIGKMLFQSTNDFVLSINNITANTSSKVTNNLLLAELKIGIDNIKLNDNGKKSAIKILSFETKIDKIDVKALKKFEKFDKLAKKEKQLLTQELISHGIHFEISDLSAKDIEFENKNLNGFKLSSAITIDKSLNLSATQQNPMAALSSIDATVKLALSDQLFALLMQQPQAMMMMVMMPIQPKDIKGSKVYDLELKGGKLYVNGKQAM